jgi:hypothetical protein
VDTKAEKIAADICLYVKNKGLNSDNFVMLDNEASTSIFKNIKLLDNAYILESSVSFGGINKNDKSHIAATHSGGFRYMSDIPVYWGQQAAANALSWSQLRDTGKYDLGYTYDGDYFYAHDNRNNYTHKFTRYGDLYGKVYDDREMENIFAFTVENNKKLYNHRQIADADKARKFQHDMGYLPTQTLTKMILDGGVKNIPVTAHDLLRADNIYGRAVASFKGKTRTMKNDRIQTEPIPREISTNQKLHVDLMYVEGVAFLISVAEPAGLTGCTHLGYGKGARAEANVKAAVMKHINKIRSHGFNVVELITDDEKGVEAAVPGIGSCGIPVNINGAGDHVVLVERKIETIKGMVRSIIHSLSYRLAYTLIAYCVMFAVMRINSVPNKTGYANISPKEALLGRKLDYKREVRAGFGDYVEATTPNIISNSMAARTDSAITLMPMGNDRGSVTMLNLATFRPITREQFTVLPTPQHVIRLMNAYADSQKSKIKENPQFFRGTTPVGDPDVLQGDGEAELNDQYILDQLDPHHPIQVVDADEHQAAADTTTLVHTADSVEPDPNLEPTTDLNPEPTLEPAVSVLGVVNEGDVEAYVEPLYTAGDENEITGVHDEPSLEQPEAETEADAIPPEPPPGRQVTAPTSHSYGTRSREPKLPTKAEAKRMTGDYIYTDIRPKNRPRKHQVHACRHHYAFRLTVVKAIFKLGREPTVKSVLAEMQQLLDKKTWHPVFKKDVKGKIIRSHMFIKEKFTADGTFEKLKSRLVAGGDQQDRDLYEDVSSPTASITSLFMLAAIAAKEGRHVVTVDIGGAYLNAHMGPNIVYMRLNVAEAEVCCMLDPTYEKYLESDGTIIVHLDKALYGCIESAQLWYNNISNTLKSMGYKQNTYDKCIFNKTIITSGGKRIQISVALYVDDLKITSRSRVLINELINKLRETYKDITVKEGLIQNYLGMCFDYSVKKKCKVTMEGYVNDLLETCKVSGIAATPALSNLFLIDKNKEFLNFDLKKWFHSTVAKVLYLAKRARPDVLVCVSFLASRVLEPNTDDFAKLNRLLKYINGSKELGIVLEPDNDLNIVSYIDASYAVHNDMRSHAGTIVSVGKGPVYAKSSRMKLMVKSSTEAEVVAASDGCTQVVWCREFLLAQGELLAPATVHQDNMSAIHLLEHESTSERSRHVKIRFYWVRDLVEKKDVNIFFTY